LDLYDVGDRFCTPQTVDEYRGIMNDPLNPLPILHVQRDINPKQMFEFIVTRYVWPHFVFKLLSKFSPKRRVIFNELSDEIEIYIPNGPDHLSLTKEKLPDGTIQTSQRMLLLYKSEAVKQLGREEVYSDITSRPKSIYVNGDDILDYVVQIATAPVLIRMLKINQSPDVESGCHVFLVFDFYSLRDATAFKLRFSPRDRVSL
jgi:hypothetical protein